jgi:hypothetical protein
MALKRGEPARDGDPLTRPHLATIRVQGAPDAPLTSGCNEFALPPRPIGIIDLPLPAQAGHLKDLISGNLAATRLHWSIIRRGPCRLDGVCRLPGGCFLEILK